MMRTRRSRREEPLADVTVGPPAGRTTSATPRPRLCWPTPVGPALMVVLDTLAPAERLAFVLHDIFAVPFDEIAAIVERSPAASRQLASRARRRVQGAAPPRNTDLGRQRQIVDAFLAALRDGDFAALVAVLDPDVVLRDDSAGLPGGAAVMRGARAVGSLRARLLAERPVRRTRPGERRRGAGHRPPGTADGGARLHLLRRPDHRDRHDLRTRPPPGRRTGHSRSLTAAAGAAGAGRDSWAD